MGAHLYLMGVHITLCSHQQHLQVQSKISGKKPSRESNEAKNDGDGSHQLQTQDDSDAAAGVDLHVDQLQPTIHSVRSESGMFLFFTTLIRRRKSKWDAQVVMRFQWSDNQMVSIQHIQVNQKTLFLRPGVFICMGAGLDHL